MYVEFDPKDDTARKRAEALTSLLRECGLHVSGPAPTLPTPQNQLPAYLGPNNAKVEANIRLTIGIK
jgi:hypothetical protein